MQSYDLLLVKGPFKEKYFKEWQGIRCDAKVSLYENDKFITSEEVEAQFTDYGLSGICTFNISSLASKALYQKNKVEVLIDFLPNKVKNILFDKQINLDELKDCLDLEKFYLAMAKQLIDVTHTTLKSDNAVHNSFVYVEKYIMAFKALREKGNYDVKIDTVSLDGRNIRYSVDDAIREYTEIKIAHPEFAVYTFDNDGKDYRNLDTAREFATSVEEYIESKSYLQLLNK